MKSYSALSDRDLTSLLKKGDKLAFNALYLKYHQAVYRNILKLTKCEEVAADLLQDVFTQLWVKKDTLDIDNSVSGWLFVVSFNQSINHTKKVLKERNHKLLAATEEVEDNTHEIHIQDLQYELLQKALMRLSPQKRRVFELCKLDGKTYDQAALEMNISKHTVKEYLSGAMTSVKEFIKSDPGYSNTFVIGLFFEYLFL